MPVDDRAPRERAVALHETLVLLFGMGELDPLVLRTTLERVSPEDVAVVLESFAVAEKLLIFRALPDEEAKGIVLEETDPTSRRDLLESITTDERVRVIGELAPDDLVDHLDALPAEEQRRVLATLDAQEAADVRELRRHAPDTAGGLMTTEFFSFRATATSEEALRAIQGNTDGFYAYAYVLDEEERLIGVVSIREILGSSPRRPLEEYMERDVVRVPVDLDREEVSSWVEHYRLKAIPVVDEADRLRGIVTFDDAMETLQEESTEDMLRLAGTTSVYPLHEPVRVEVLRRLPFLAVTMIGGASVAMILDRYLEVFAATMIVWIHPVSALSGNVGVVTSTVMVTGWTDLGAKRLRRALLRELFVSGLIGLLLATAAAVAFWIYDRGAPPEVIAERGYGTGQAVTVLCGAMVASLAWAGLVGGTVPIVCRLLRIDPAIASGPFVTITCDISASIIFLTSIWLFVGAR